MFQHDLDLYEKLQIAEEQLAISQSIISNIRTAQTPLKRPRTRRHIKPLSDTGILTIRDANRSIEVKKAKETEKEKRRIEKQIMKECIRSHREPSDDSVLAELEGRAPNNTFILPR